MTLLRCPSCAAPFESQRPDPLSRCAWCGALLSPAVIAGTLYADPRLDVPAARRAVALALGTEASEWQPVRTTLVAYPFAADGPARNPFRPLAGLPSSLTAGWRPSGSDLATTRDACLPDVAIVVAPAEQPAGGTNVIVYPFYRVELRRDEQETAAWCDGVDGQVVLPDTLRPASAGAGPPPPDTSTAMIGAGLGLVLPLPWSLAALALAAAGVMRARISNRRDGDGP